MKKVDKTQLLTENDDLLKAVIKEFAYNTYQEASVNEIIKNANYNKGSFYYRFKNKEELFVALLDYVIVKQISLFKDNNLPFSRISKIEEMLYELFINLINLYNYNFELFYVLTKHQSDNYSKRIIEEQCLSPLINRFLIQFKRFTYLPHYEDMLIVIENLYYNFPETILNSNNPSAYLKKLINYLISNESIEMDSKITISLDNFIPKSDISYILAQEKKIEYNTSYSIMSSNLQFFNQIKSELKSKTRLLFYSYKRIIKRLIQSSIKDYSLYKPFISEKIFKSVKNNPFFEQFLITLFYCLLKEQPIIVLDFMLNSFSNIEKSLFLEDILPIISKTSKIIIVDDRFDELTLDNSLYLLDQSSNLNELDIISLAKQLKNDTFNYSYANGNNRFNKVLSIEDINNYNVLSILNNSNFISINKVFSITYDKIIKSEDLYEKIN